MNLRFCSVPEFAGESGAMFNQHNLHRTGHIQICKHETLLVVRSLLVRGGLPSCILRSRSIFWLKNTGDTVVWSLWLKSWSWRRTMSAEDWSVNGKIPRTGSDESETADGDETGWSETFVAIKRKIVELRSLSGYFSRKKSNLETIAFFGEVRPVRRKSESTIKQQEASVSGLDIDFGLHMWRSVEELGAQERKHRSKRRFLSVVFTVLSFRKPLLIIV